MTFRWFRDDTPLNTRRHLEEALALPNDHADQEKRGHTYTQTDAIEAQQPKPRSYAEWMQRHNNRRTA